MSTYRKHITPDGASICFWFDWDKMKWNFLIGYISLVQREGLSSGTTRMSRTTGSRTLLKGQIALSTGQIPRGGGVLPYMGYIDMCRCEGYGFQAVYSWMGYINQSVWVQNRVSFFRKLISWLKTRDCWLKTRDCGIRFCFGWTVLVTSVVSSNQLL